MKKLSRLSGLLLSLGLVVLLLASFWPLWQLYRQSRVVDPQTLENLLPSLNISAIKKAAELLRGS